MVSGEDLGSARNEPVSDDRSDGTSDWEEALSLDEGPLAAPRRFLQESDGHQPPNVTKSPPSGRHRLRGVASGHPKATAAALAGISRRSRREHTAPTHGGEIIIEFEIGDGPPEETDPGRDVT